MRRNTSPPSSPPLTPTGPATLLTYEQLSAWLGVPVSTLRSMVHRGQIPAVRLSSRICRFDRIAIEAMLESRRTACGGDS